MGMCGNGVQTGTVNTVRGQLQIRSDLKGVHYACIAAAAEIRLWFFLGPQLGVAIFRQVAIIAMVSEWLLLFLRFPSSFLPNQA